MNAHRLTMQALKVTDSPEYRWEQQVDNAMKDAKVIDELSGYLSDEQLTTQSMAVSKILAGTDEGSRVGHMMLDDLYRPLVEQKLKDEAEDEREEAKAEMRHCGLRYPVERWLW
jgi:hypothetical protein